MVMSVFMIVLQMCFEFDALVARVIFVKHIPYVQRTKY